MPSALTVRTLETRPVDARLSTAGSLLGAVCAQARTFRQVTFWVFQGLDIIVGWRKRRPKPLRAIGVTGVHMVVLHGVIAAQLPAQLNLAGAVEAVEQLQAGGGIGGV